MSFPAIGVPPAANSVSQGASTLFPIKPTAYVPQKPIIPPVPKGWQYIGGPVKDVKQIKGIPVGIKRVLKPAAIPKISYGQFKLRTIYWRAPDGSIYASLDGRVPETYYEGDVKRTRMNHVIWGYRWLGSTARAHTGGGSPINKTTVSGGGKPQKQTPMAPPIGLPGIGAEGSTGGTPANPDTPPQDLYPVGVPEGEYGWSLQPDLDDQYVPGREYGPSAEPNYLLYGAIGLGVLAATLLIWRTAA